MDTIGLPVLNGKQRGKDTTYVGRSSAREEARQGRIDGKGGDVPSPSSSSSAVLIDMLRSRAVASGFEYNRSSVIWYVLGPGSGLDVGNFWAGGTDQQFANYSHSPLYMHSGGALSPAAPGSVSGGVRAFIYGVVQYPFVGLLSVDVKVRNCPYKRIMDTLLCVEGAELSCLWVWSVAAVRVVISFTISIREWNSFKVSFNRCPVTWPAIFSHCTRSTSLCHFLFCRRTPRSSGLLTRPTLSPPWGAMCSLFRRAGERNIGCVCVHACV